MVLVSDFNKDLTGLFRSKYPNENKSFELNISSSSKNPTHNYSIATKRGEVCKVLKPGKTSNSVLLLDGNSSFKWDLLSTQIETKVDMGGLTTFKARTKPKYGIGLMAKYERNQKNSPFVPSSPINNASTMKSGVVEVGGDVQGNNFHTRVRFYPPIDKLGCNNKTSKERNNADGCGTGVSISSTLTTSKLIFPNNLSFGVMMSNSEMSLNSMKITLGMLLKGPLFGFMRKASNNNHRFSGNNDLDFTLNYNNNNTSHPSYNVSFQTNTSNASNEIISSGRISGFTGGVCLNNLFNGFLTLGASLTYGTRREFDIINNGSSGEVSLNPLGADIGDKKSDIGSSPKSSPTLSSFSPPSMSSSSSSSSYLLASYPLMPPRSVLSRIQYTVGGKISFGKMKSGGSGVAIEDGSKFGRNFQDEFFPLNNLGNNKSTDLKFKFSSDNNISYSLTHRFNKCISATFGTSIDLNKVNISHFDSVKYGFSMDLSL